MSEEWSYIYCFMIHTAPFLSENVTFTGMFNRPSVMNHEIIVSQSSITNSMRCFIGVLICSDNPKNVMNKTKVNLNVHLNVLRRYISLKVHIQGIVGVGM